MDRKVITAAIVEQAERLLVFGIDHATIAARLGITEYVVSVMAGNRHRNGRREARDLSARHVRNRQNAVDASVVRMVQRLLAVGILNHRQIAREAGVSPNFVARIARGRRVAISTIRPVLNEGERLPPYRSVWLGAAGQVIWEVSAYTFISQECGRGAWAGGSTVTGGVV